MSDLDTITPVSVEQDGRIFSGVGVSEDSLRETMDRQAPEPVEPEAEPQPEPPPHHATTQARQDGTFAKKSRGQKRFDELTAAREEATRRAEAAEREREDLRRQLEDARKPRTEAARTPEPQAAPTPAATRPKPTEDEVGTKYATYGEYVEDLADWKAEQRLAALDFDARIRQSIEADRASRTFSDHIQALWTKGREAYSDFDAVLGKATVEFSPQQLTAIAQAPHSEHIQYALARDEARARELAKEADLARFGFALAQLIPAAAVASTASTARTVVPPPPAPMQPVAGGGSTTVPSSAELAARGDSDFDRSGYREKRAKERGVRSRW